MSHVKLKGSLPVPSAASSRAGVRWPSQNKGYSGGDITYRQPERVLLGTLGLGLYSQYLASHAGLEGMIKVLPVKTKKREKERGKKH